MLILVVLYVVVLIVVIGVIVTGLVLLIRDIRARMKTGGKWEDAVPPLFTWRFLSALAIAVVVGLIGQLAGGGVNWFGIVAAGIEAGLAADLGRYCVTRWGKHGVWDWAWAAALVASAILALRAIG